MGKHFRVNVPMITILIILVAMKNLDPVSADCCSPIKIEYFCMDPPFLRNNCNVKICKDGLPVSGFYCGLKSCNIFGCNCEGGCRTNSEDKWESAIGLFALDNVLLSNDILYSDD